MLTDTKVVLTNLTPDHFSALRGAMCAILSSHLASNTYAQIVDGLPTRDVYKNYYGWYRIDYETNLAPGQEAVDIITAYRRRFDLRTVSVDEKVARSYQNEPIGSRKFSLRLLQIISIVCHDIAVHLYTEYDGGIRKSSPDFDPQVPVPSTPPGMTFPPLPKMPRRPAEFFHDFYMDWEHYPHGAADLVGYWAEYQLFGGVMLFDRGRSETEFRDVYIQPIGRHHIFKLSETQILNCVSVLLSEPSADQDTSDAFRFQADKYAIRVDPYDTSMTHISRDQGIPRKIPMSKRTGCVRRGENDPYLMDAMKTLAERTRTIPPPE